MTDTNVTPLVTDSQTQETADSKNTDFYAGAAIGAAAVVACYYGAKRVIQVRKNRKAKDKTETTSENPTES